MSELYGIKRFNERQARAPTVTWTVYLKTSRWIESEAWNKGRFNGSTGLVRLIAHQISGDDTSSETKRQSTQVLLDTSTRTTEAIHLILHYYESARIPQTSAPKSVLIKEAIQEWPFTQWDPMGPGSLESAILKM